MSKIIKNSDVNDFWLDCFKENNNNNKSNSNFPKKNISQNLAFKPLIKYNSQLKRNKRIYKHDNNLSYQNNKLIKTIINSEEKLKSIDKEKEQKTIELYNSLYNRGMLFKQKKQKTLSQINKNNKTLNPVLYHNKSLEKKLKKNYTKLSMYERGVKYEQQKKAHLAQLFQENNKRVNKVYPFRPNISFKNLNRVFFSDNYCKEQTSNDSNKIFLSRLIRAREEEEIKKNWIENSLKEKTINKMKFNNKKLKKSLSQKDSLNYKQKLHQSLINLKCLPTDGENEINNNININNE
jgi:hypothetical protein